MGWTHEEAKQHSIIERLYERCATFSPDGLDCSRGGVPYEDWCERCLAADLILELDDK